MKLSRYKEKNIFCIEGNWGQGYEESRSIRTALNFLNASVGISAIRKGCNNPEQFNSYLKDSVKDSYDTFGIIYLAFHGSPGKLHINHHEKIDFTSIAATLQGKAKDKIIHFGSCSTLRLSGWDLRRFKKATGALAISGYCKDIDFIESTVLDILYFRKCQAYQKVSLIHRDMQLSYGKLVKQMGFKMLFEK
jgi:hypothetical protein